MGGVFTHGKMGEGMKESINMIRSMGTEYIPGQTSESMRENGLMVNSMEKANIYYLMDLLGVVCGMTAKGSDGMMRQVDILR